MATSQPPPQPGSAAFYKKAGFPNATVSKMFQLQKLVAEICMDGLQQGIKAEKVVNIVNAATLQGVTNGLATFNGPEDEGLL